MTEQEWMTGTDVWGMLEVCTGQKTVVWPDGRPAGPPHVSDRKLRLFAVACCRAVWDRLTDERSRRAVEVAERYADGEVEERELRDALFGASARFLEVDYPWPEYATAWVAELNAEACVTNLVRTDGFTSPPLEEATMAHLLREIVGNPFKPPSFFWKEGGANSRPAYLTPKVLSIAQAAYQQRARMGPWRGSVRSWFFDGTLDPDRLAILADALEDEGCQDEELLWHLRGYEWGGSQLNGVPLPLSQSRRRSDKGHVRGCWVLDLLLAKE